MAETPAQANPKAGGEEDLGTLQGGVKTAWEAYVADPTDEARTAFDETLTKLGAYKPPAPPEPPKAPEKYELKTEEGSVLTPSDVDKIASYAKERGLSNEAAQAELDRVEATIKADREAQAEAQLADVEKLRTEWLEEARKDPAIGGDKFKATVALANRVIEKFGSEAFKKTMDDTGFGNHPEVLRIFSAIGGLLTDDQLVLAKDHGGGAGDKTMEEVFYDHPSSKAQ